MIAVIEQWLPAVFAVAAWPIGIVVMVLAVLVLVPRDQQGATLTGIAEVVGAARGRVLPSSSAAARANANENEEVPDAGRVAAVGAGDTTPGRQSDEGR